MRFAEIPGHNEIKQQLAAMVDGGHMPHALLLEGPEGTAKFALARALAQYIHCSNRHDGDSCGICKACRQVQNFRHVDTLYSFPVVKPAGKTAISDDYFADFQAFLSDYPWNSFEGWLKTLNDPKTLPAIYVHEGIELIRRVNFTTQSSAFKTVLMWLPERMNEDTSNKLLKVIEEPFDDTIFIFSSDDPQKILPTIYSRVQRVKVPPYSQTELSEWLQHENGVDAAAAADVAVLADGSLNQALKYLGANAESQAHLDNFVKLMRLAYNKNISALKAWSNDLGSLTRERQIRFLEYCAHMIRENYIYNLNNPQYNRLTAAESAFSKNFARFINERNAVELYSQFDTAAKDIGRNANAKIVLFDLAVQTFMLLRR